MPHGEVFAWLNSDDTYQPGAITQAIEFLHAHPQAAMVYGDANLIDEQGNVIGRFPARQTNLKKTAARFGPYPPTDYILLGKVVAARLDRSIHLFSSPWIMISGCAWLSWRLWFTRHACGRIFVCTVRENQ